MPINACSWTLKVKHTYAITFMSFILEFKSRFGRCSFTFLILHHFLFLESHRRAVSSEHTNKRLFYNFFSSFFLRQQWTHVDLNAVSHSQTHHWSSYFLFIANSQAQILPTLCENIIRNLQNSRATFFTTDLLEISNLNERLVRGELFFSVWTTATSGEE